MSLVIDPLESAQDLKAFIALPYRLYADDPRWVAPLVMDMKERLDEQRHPFFKHGKARSFLARRNGRVVGRITALVDRAWNEYHSEQAAGFGFLEFEEDDAIAAALLDQAARWSREEGMEVLRGPFNYSTNEECGTLVEGFDEPPCVMMPYTPPWHAGILSSLELDTAQDLVSYYTEYNPRFARLGRICERAVKRHDLDVRPVNMKRFSEEVELLLDIYNTTWERNWGFVPMESDEFRWHATKMKQIIEPRLVLIVSSRGRPAGFALSVPDVYQALKHLNGRLLPFGLFKFLWHRRSINGIRVVAMGIRPEFRSIGAEGVLIHRTIENGVELGFERAELGWVLEGNVPMRNLAENIGARVYKRYRIWETAL
jgi:GNAT superfamily N-acetyltransferase